MARIDRVHAGEALVGDGNEVAHIDLIIGPRGSPAEGTFCRALTTQREGVNGLLAVIGPNLMCKPSTVMFNKVAIKNGKQAVQMFGPAQRAVATAVADCVKEGTIAAEQADDLFICAGVFIHWDADDDSKIQDFNYRATKLAIERAMRGEPTATEVLAQAGRTTHPFAVAETTTPAGDTVDARSREAAARVEAARAAEAPAVAPTAEKAYAGARPGSSTELPARRQWWSPLVIGAAIGGIVRYFGKGRQ